MYSNAASYMLNGDRKFVAVLDFIIPLERDIFQGGITLQMVYLMGFDTHCAEFELICSYV